ncbi:ArsR/SmtB family transcription factor [Streptomyces sp. NPDC058424]|uniref:ArsR/SmtB family transcription factor n=1 Tax=Streptomyces sp. NPDC058424 TaxID=3346491 RepID=UPI003656993F
MTNTDSHQRPQAQRTDTGPPADPAPEVFERAAAVFRLLGSPTRLHLAWLVARSEFDVTTLARQTGASVSAASRHMTAMKNAGVVCCRSQGARQLYTADPAFAGLVRAVVAPFTVPAMPGADGGGPGPDGGSGPPRPAGG